MKRFILTVVILAGLLTIGFDLQNKKMSLAQHTLARPDNIRVMKGGNEILFEPSDNEFPEIFDLISNNWPLTFNREGKPVKILCLSSISEITDDDILIIFTYQEPVAWNNHYTQDDRKDTLSIRVYGFLIPSDITESGARSPNNYQGAVLISEDEQLFGKSNMYVCYHSGRLLKLLQELEYQSDTE